MPTIRPLNDDDASTVARLLSELHGEVGTASRLADPTEQILIAEDDLKGAIGLLSLRVDSDTHTGKITTLYVLPTHRRQKIAMLLLAEAERTSRAQGIAEVKARVEKTNSPAAAFFHAMGYTSTESGFKKQLPPKRSANSRRAEG